MGSVASLYIGEWNNGFKCGYGVLDDITSGEKYMGMWSNDMKNGQGCVVTFNGLYYEGIFSQNKMSGKGLMLFEDESLYEGHFADIGVFNGAGSLIYPNGDKLEGSFYGSYTNGMKFNGTIHKLPQTPTSSPAAISNVNAMDKIGIHSVIADNKWKSVYGFYYNLLAIPPKGSRQQAMPNTSIIWEQLAISINQAKNNAKLNLPEGLKDSRRKNSLTASDLHLQKLATSMDLLDGLEMIPDYHCDELTHDYMANVNAYLSKAFSSPYHPLENLMVTLCECFNTTYVS